LAETAFKVLKFVTVAKFALPKTIFGLSRQSLYFRWPLKIADVKWAPPLIVGSYSRFKELLPT